MMDFLYVRVEDIFLYAMIYQRMKPLYGSFVNNSASFRKLPVR